jgi:hypothetical protein
MSAFFGVSSDECGEMSRMGERKCLYKNNVTSLLQTKMFQILRSASPKWQESVDAANVARSRKALIEKDIPDSLAGIISFQDPMYRFWLGNSFLGS